jgi:succinyl-CoA synthetase beta subunit
MDIGGLTVHEVLDRGGLPDEDEWYCSIVFDRSAKRRS